MRLRVLAILTVLIHFTAASISRSSAGMENEALLVSCPREGSSEYPVEWYYSNTNRSVTTQKGNRVFAGGEYLKLLPAKVEDSGVYTCIVRSSTFVKTGHMNVTIYKKQPGCKIPSGLIYSKISGSEKNSKIYCPTIKRYNWTAPVEWFKNCKVLQGSRYFIQEAYLLIDNATNEDTGDYTCKFMHNENGVSYSVTATRSFAFHSDEGFSLFPEIIAPTQNETRDVEVGKAVNITCSACFGKGSQFMTTVLWQVNGTNVRNVSEARIWQEQEQNQSSSSALTCRSAILRIVDVREEDLLLRYDCKAVNLHGVRHRSLRLRRKKPIDRQSTYYMLAGFGILLMLINIMMIMLKVFWIEVILLWRDVARPYKARNDGKIYDAYVIYPRTHKDSPEGTCSVEYFVHQVLPDVLENKCGYSLCIYGRDLLPGEDVATAVETNIRKSRRHIFVLAPGGVHSEELAYEQEVALHSALVQGDAKAILIEVQAPGGLQLAGLPRSLQHLVQVQGTIKWREDHVANKRSLNSRFWKHVRYHMPVPSKPPCKTALLAP
ncbi:PREDICTED: interleukin-1 receptor-like 1 [Myotis davidii]|uniref:Interleukin-1 receptor-like 1 n=1 Tax=Myotis davidii TaxID=225400 RepID=L5M1T9_MYODS|nr:PREDICTED: interleukin-1 receptor-like 1 [Myotis davidii]ELK32287.1 Interleukin-1 receptor-like 1 [Myotis davidii]